MSGGEPEHVEDLPHAGGGSEPTGKRRRSLIEALVRPGREGERETVEEFAEATEEGRTGTEFRLFEEPPSLLSDPEAVSELVATYGVIRAFFMARTGRYLDLQRTLEQARIGATYDRYLTRLVKVTVAVAVVGVAVGAAVSWLLLSQGVFQAVGAPAGLSRLFPAWIVNTIGDARGVIGSVAVTVGVGGGLAAITWYAGLLYPGNRANTRERKIDFVLPDAIVFMYALSDSGMNLADIIKHLADAEDAYGEVAAEFDMIRRDIEFFGNDIYTSLRNARNLTPSDNFQQFVDDLLSLVDSGGEVTSFLEDQSETYLDRAKDQQASFLDTLAIMSEVFIVAFVAAPLFLIVILLVISLLGGSYLAQLTAIIYIGLPLGFVGFGVLLSVLLEPYVYEERELDEPAESSPEIEGDPTEDPAYATFRRQFQLRKLRERVAHPIAFFRAEPLRTLWVTVPLAGLYLVGLLQTGLLPLSVSGWTAAPVGVTNRVVILPMLVVFVPLSVLHELERRRDAEISRRFPDTLSVLASANNMGIALSDALDVVARWSSGVYARQLQILRNDIRWTSDTSGALVRFGNRLEVPALTRTIKLLAEGRRSTSDLTTVLRIAAEDTRNRFELGRKRQQEMISYVAVVVISFLVFIGVVIMLDVSYLAPIAELAATSPSAGPSGSPTNLGDIPIGTYRLLFFHAVVVQAVGSGLMSGILTDNTLRTGLKYSVGLLIVAGLAFSVI